MGGRTLVAVLRQLLRGTATPRAQDGSKVVRAPKITTAVARVDWGQPAHTIEARHRGFGHHSPLWTSVPDVVTADAARDPTLQLLAVSIVGDQPDVLATLEEPQRGTAVLDKRGKRVLVSTGEGAWVQVTRVKAAGKKEMPATEWWNGLPKDVRNRGWVLFE